MCEFGCELHVLLVAAAEGTGEIEACVANTFEFAYLAHHLANLFLGVVAEVGIADLLQVAGNGQLQFVGEVFCFLYLLKHLV